MKMAIWHITTHFGVEGHNCDLLASCKVWLLVILLLLVMQTPVVTPLLWNKVIIFSTAVLCIGVFMRMSERTHK